MSTYRSRFRLRSQSSLSNAARRSSTLKPVLPDVQSDFTTQDKVERRWLELAKTAKEVLLEDLTSNLG